MQYQRHSIDRKINISTPVHLTSASILVHISIGISTSAGETYMDINRLLSGGALELEGFLVSQKGGRLTFQVHPGLTIEVDEKACEKVEQAADPVSGKTYVRITLSPDADLNATFQPKLARLALTSGASGVPFTMGGLPEGVEQGPIYFAPTGPGGGGPGGGTGGYNTDTIGEFNTRSRHVFWGWINDDKTYSDRQTDGVIA